MPASCRLGGFAVFDRFVHDLFVTRLAAVAGGSIPPASCLRSTPPARRRSSVPGFGGALDATSHLAGGRVAALNSRKVRR
jgi:hypothetical protein